MKDIHGINRGYCKKCGKAVCPEFIQESGARCGYCDCVPVQHVVTDETQAQQVSDYTYFVL